MNLASQSFGLRMKQSELVQRHKGRSERPARLVNIKFHMAATDRLR